MKEKKKLKVWQIILIIVGVLFLMSMCGSNSKETVKENTEVKEKPVEVKEEINEEYKIKYGELLDTKVNGNTLIIKTKIEPNFTNKMTIDQNYYNVENLIREQGCDSFDEIQYWAVADMTSGNEEKVIAFTLDKELIDAVNNQNVLPPDMGNYVDDLYIHISLRE